MVTAIDRLTESGCSIEHKNKVCRSRGGESCAFDGAMIVLQPIADTAHLVHGPIACCGNSWEGRGSSSRTGGGMPLHQMGFTTDMGEIDIVYGSEEKLFTAILKTYESVSPKAVFVYSTCVSGLIGEDIDAVCKRAARRIDVPVIPVHAPGFAGPKNLGNRIAGEVLLDHVIGTGEPPVMTHYDINLIGEYNIAGDLWLIEPLLEKAGIRILSKITGDSTFKEITWAHRAKFNVVVCSRALINVAQKMEQKYGIPYVEASFFGSTETAKALRAIGSGLSRLNGLSHLNDLNRIDALIRQEERQLRESLKPYQHLRGRKAVLYTGGVKSWSFISALRDLGIEIVAVGTKKSTFEDEEKMKSILGPNAPLEENVAPGNLLRLLKERGADMLIAGGRNQYLAAKEGYPFVDVNQERHTAYAAYTGLLNLAEQISNSMRFYEKSTESGVRSLPAFTSANRASAGCAEWTDKSGPDAPSNSALAAPHSTLRINPLKHSPSIGAALALQGIDRAVPVIHGAQGCAFLGKVLLTKHFREPIALAGSKLFVEDVVMGSEERLKKTTEELILKNNPEIIAVLSSGLTEVKGDDIKSTIDGLQTSGEDRIDAKKTLIIHVRTPDYDGGMETGYARAVEMIIAGAALPQQGRKNSSVRTEKTKQINILAGSHLTPADCLEMREIVESFGLKAVILPDLSALDGSRQGFSSLSAGGTTRDELESMAQSSATVAVGISMKQAAALLQQKFGIEYRVLEGISGLGDMDRFIRLLEEISGLPAPTKYERLRRTLVDGMRDAQIYFGSKKICLALEPDHAVQVSRWLRETGATVELAVIPTLSDAADAISAREVRIGDLFSIDAHCDLLIANSHAEYTAKRLNAPLYEMGFPVYKTLGYTAKVMIGYRGTLLMMYEIANLLMRGHESQ